MRHEGEGGLQRQNRGRLRRPTPQCQVAGADVTRLGHGDSTGPGLTAAAFRPEAAGERPSHEGGATTTAEVKAQGPPQLINWMTVYYWGVED